MKARERGTALAANGRTVPQRQTFDGAPLLQRSRSHWQLGDWGSLAALDEESGLADHPDRDRLSLLAAAGHAQLGQDAAMEHALARAIDWGCERDLAARVLVSGLLNGLARASIVLRDDDAAQRQFEEAIHCVTPDADCALLARARGIQERAAMGLLPEAMRLVETSAQLAEESPGRREVQALRRDVSLLRAALAGPLLSTQALRAAAVDPDGKVAATLAEVLAEKGDPLMALAARAEALRPEDQARLHIALADHFQKNDPLMAIDALTSASDVLPAGHPDLRLALTHRLLAMNLGPVALRGMVRDMVAAPGLFTLDEQARLLASLSAGEIQDKGHGHVLLMAHLCGAGARTLKPGQVVIEIGTTRENVPNQGSTAILGKFCADLGLRFITVDMDPFNTARAAQFFDRQQWEFEAVTAKGEDFLAGWEGMVDHVFLDAYDFDHGKHSERRQARYETYLGSRIDEEQCHKMHLDCAVSIVRILAPDGTLCIDDTWQDETGAWTAKGTTAVPYLLANGFEIIDARNNAVLMRRKPAGKTTRKPAARPKTEAKTKTPPPVKAPARQKTARARGTGV